jgi:hypothetical protein
MGPRALQNPGLTDWRLSPASFAASPKTLVGADGCEELVPANLALQQFVLRQVVRLANPPGDFGIPNNTDYRPARARSVVSTGRAQKRPTFRSAI